MSLVDKIKAQLKAKYPKVNLSQKRIDAIAARLDKKITEESEIDAQLEAINDITPFAEMAKEDDRLRTLESKAKAGDPNKGKPKPGAEEDEDDDDEDEDDDPAKNKPASGKSGSRAPKWARELIESNKELSQKLQQIEKDRTASTILDKVKAHEKLKDIDPAFYNGRTLPDSEDGIEDFVTSVETDYLTIKQKFADQGLGGNTAPVLGGPNKEGVSTAVETYIKNKTAPEKSAGDLGGKKLD